MRYSGGDPNLGNTGGLGHQVQESPASMMRMVPLVGLIPVSPQKQINQFDKLDAIRTLGNMTEAQRMALQINMCTNGLSWTIFESNDGRQRSVLTILWLVLQPSIQDHCMKIQNILENA